MLAKPKSQSSSVYL